ncbi:MAG: HNH endonuclease [Gammaproteobacteria bacterium]|nr:HNH endonuclease [Gammaproteobacteria bacterium]
MSIPKEIGRSHLVRAIEEIDKSGVPPKRGSVNWDLIHNRKRYPPKYVVSLAHKYVSGEEWHPESFITSDARRFLKNKGFRVVRKTDELPPENFGKAYPEGKAAYKQHRQWERNPKISQDAKQARLEQDGDLACDVCGFSFADIYGKLGQNFIEAHHTIPVAEMRKQGKTETSIEEIALVCSNCHRMLHKGKSLLSIEALKKILARNKQNQF